ncbi:hypothetical protein D9757_011492 [Collybiopsis confluens]|uniref:Uncharacterized protein n=1 Tax=Collybiopsis confluens TaxID=2823264 RepID=A0A8H5LWA4_9AGAR|nr:hypothetical protein D9757_014389 [Collybiopsis confluens]KAF5371918.1 hypothetical protein D9757_011492 [Collybiopsis confluens]
MVPNEIIESLIMAFPPLCTTVSSFRERLKEIEGFLTAPPPPSGQELSKRFFIDFDLRAKDRWYESPPKLYYGQIRPELLAGNLVLFASFDEIDAAFVCNRPCFKFLKVIPASTRSVPELSVLPALSVFAKNGEYIACRIVVTLKLVDNNDHGAVQSAVHALSIHLHPELFP